MLSLQVVFSRHCSPCDIKELLYSSSNIPRFPFSLFLSLPPESHIYMSTEMLKNNEKKEEFPPDRRNTAIMMVDPEGALVSIDPTMPANSPK